MLIIPATLVSLLVFRDVKLLVVLAIYYGYRCAAVTIPMLALRQHCRTD